MSCIAVCESSIVVAKGLVVDVYDYSSHNYIHALVSSQSFDKDHIIDIAISNNSKHLAFITSASKKLLVYTLPLTNDEVHKTYQLPRSASRIRFTTNDEQILVADKSGDVLIFNIKEKDGGSKLLGHLSLLLDVLQTGNGKHIITCDRDEKIRVSCYPNTYNIESFCLGHSEFVNHIEMLPHNSNLLTSTSGDGTIRVWDYIKGQLIYCIDTFLDINDEELRLKFCKLMEEDGVEVNALPIVHYTVTQLNESSSLCAVYVHSYNAILFYHLQSTDNETNYLLVEKLTLDYVPAAFKFYKLCFYIYNDINCNIKIYNILRKPDNIHLQFANQIDLVELSNKIKETKNNFEIIKVLYKRKFDNVQEYQERKKQRLEKNSK
ncbi:tRNA (guanine-N(7)-)-methyltransferase non-catalytic subunit wuho [Amyelois transitella]|uniref:tRNA (guanine-N(7)-)-methyltransferase non-catalytic subunit wuho n=1 Tax=Amyelois transitella TaxID=680683 RepID=UPI00067AE050|nr:tRNA (guanine-N(7)-)-methyltransferase non-catalytic subunit wuho [Amyelois transitella]